MTSSVPAKARCSSCYGSRLAFDGGAEAEEVVGLQVGQRRIAIGIVLDVGHGEGDDGVDVLLGLVAEAIGHLNLVERDEQLLAVHADGVGSGENQPAGLDLRG